MAEPSYDRNYRVAAAATTLAIAVFAFALRVLDALRNDGTPALDRADVLLAVFLGGAFGFAVWAAGSRHEAKPLQPSVRPGDRVVVTNDDIAAPGTVVDIVRVGSPRDWLVLVAPDGNGDVVSVAARDVRKADAR
jgi:hypothetical protein